MRFGNYVFFQSTSAPAVIEVRTQGVLSYNVTRNWSERDSIKDRELPGQGTKFGKGQDSFGGRGNNHAIEPRSEWHHFVLY